MNNLVLLLELLGERRWGRVERSDSDVIPQQSISCVVIVDEAQNVTHNQMEMVIGRLGRNSRMVICGDVSQIDLRYKKESGFAFLPNVEAQVKGFKLVTLKHNHRHEIVQPILDIYSNYRD